MFTLGRKDILINTSRLTSVIAAGPSMPQKATSRWEGRGVLLQLAGSYPTLRQHLSPLGVRGEVIAVLLQEASHVCRNMNLVKWPVVNWMLIV